VSLDDDARAELLRLEAEHRLRVPRIVDSAQGPRVTLDGVEVLNFASNDYLSLARDARLALAAKAALDDAGVGAGASRLIVGNHRHHVEAEHAIGDWLQREGVRLFTSGYAANVGLLTAILRPEDVVFSDALNHASLIDGCRLSRAKIVVFPHRDLAALESQLSSSAGRGRRRLVISETLFSMDGDLADVEALATLSRRHDAALLLDEAHALGMYGPEGRGVAAAAAIVPDLLVGTGGKALGGFGAFVACSRPIAQLLWSRARSLVFSTGLPPSIPAALTAAVEIVRGTEGDQRRRTVRAHAQRLRAAVPKLGGAPDSPIAPRLLGDDQRTMAETARLLESRVFVQGIRPPTVPEGTARLRVSLAAGHTTEDVDQLAALLCSP
jgi:8-amino-7-oxononanoate synthase